MHIRTFQAPTLQEALAEIRRQMGSDATVLHTRDVHRGMFGLLGKSHVEVTAGLKPKPVHPPRASQPPVPSASEAPQTGKPVAERSSPEVRHLTEQVSRLSKVVQALEHAHSVKQTPVTAVPEVRSPDARVAKALNDHGIDRSNADWIASQIAIDDATSDENLLPVLRQRLRKRYRTTGPIDVPRDSQRIVALVGPTGVGKTTTIAKLAAGFRLLEKRSVGLITIDTFRIAAVDQLHKYAQVMQLPMEVVAGADEMRAAMQRLRDVDLILIDTVGRSPRDHQQLEITRKLLAHAKPHETHLVLSATSSRSAIESAIQNFAVLDPTAVIISKLDEVERQPDLICFSDAGVPPISYVTTGQNVPDDIDLPQPSRLIELALDGGRHPSSEPAFIDDSKRPERRERASDTREATANSAAEKSTAPRNLLLPSN
ncbi:Flagellar biosynthesis protein FlhF [Rosistilla carotiformis]|uniref:Flagellar biosynthesis protein FlhF n=1 Tax=Rosistilla carotiformis TaxID=2528017 RepID=A0A518JNZ8_9BACT|nr:flagellar biosynthesis protein FlhF [Rosistilla carotiformis]QDV67270.1 Flagellar biosynthesis protein FlhF [Rosistilla carotiformis]